MKVGEVTDRRPTDKHTDTRRQPLPDAAAVYCLQGKLWHAHQELNKAIECYAEALKLNPFMWDAFLGLCDLGIPSRMEKRSELNDYRCQHTGQ